MRNIVFLTTVTDLDRRGWSRTSRTRATWLAEAGLICTLVLVGHLSAQSVTSEGFDSDEPTWHITQAQGNYRLESQQRVAEGAHSGAACELVVLQAAAGSQIELGLDITPARIIQEFTPSVWLRSDRARPRLSARVVFPHSRDPRTRQPLTRLIAGPTYADVGQWRRLQLVNVPTLVAQAARPLQAELGGRFDAHEAYIDRLVLSVVGAGGSTRLWIDDLELPGLVTAEGVAAATTSRAEGSPHRIELSGPVLLVDGLPLLPRVIEYQGEPLSTLRTLGFNAVKLRSPPSDELLAEARRAGLWLVCPPPRGPATDADDEDAAIEIDDRYAPVVAWDLGQGQTTDELDSIRRWAEETRRADSAVNRPLVCDPLDDLKGYSRVADILLLHRHVVGTSFELADFETWLRERPALARLGTPTWATIDTEFSKELIEQMSLFSGGQSPQPVAEYEQLRLLTQAAVAAGVRGLVFSSRSPLDASDAQTRTRAAILRLINLELDLVQEWAAAGTRSDTVQAAAESSEMAITGAVLPSKHTRLLLPYWTGSGAQYVAGQLAANDVVFVVPGAPEANSAYEITVGGLRPLARRRGQGGIHVKVPEFGLTSLVLLTDELGVAPLTRRLLVEGPLAARLERDLAVWKLRQVTELDARLMRMADRVPGGELWLSQARAALEEADQALGRNDYLSGCMAAHRSMRAVRLLERTHWEKAVAALGSPIASPLATTFVTLPYHWQFVRALESRTPLRSLLRHGDMEGLHKDMQLMGWNLFQHKQADVAAYGELSYIEPHGGRKSLRLTAEPADDERPPTLIETAPIWLTTPPVPVAAGQWLRIHLWVRIPKPITGSLDGLMILDSFGREPLAERIGVTSGWKEVKLYRAAPAAGEMTVTVALTGLGEAFIDDLTIEPLVTSMPSRTPATAIRGRPPKPGPSGLRRP